jgi:chemotaxis protein MotB
MDFGEDQKYEKGKTPIWLITFGDVVALLLTFFVMLFATTKIPSEKWESIAGTMSDSLQFPQAGRAPNPQTDQSIAVVTLEEALPIEYLTGILSEHLGQDEILNKAIVRQRDGRVVISLFGAALFDPGGSTLNEAARDAVHRLGGVLANIGNQLEIYGHADPTLEEGIDFESNWTLSLTRASTVAKALSAAGYQRNIVFLGLGDSRYSHLNPALSELRRSELARRVDIVIHETVEER